jgi:tetratricopeptide (TPR) repeat protein
MIVLSDARRGSAARLLVTILIVCALCASVTSAAGEKGKAKAEPDRFARAQRAIQQKQYLIARQCLLDFLNASVGDPRIDRAKEVLSGVWMKHADELFAAGATLEGVTVLIECADYYKTGSLADKARNEAKAHLTTAFAEAVKKKEFDDAVATAESYSDHFLSDPPLATDEELNGYRADALAAALSKHIPPEVMVDMLDRALFKGVKVEMLEQRKVRVSFIRLTYAQSLLDDGYYAKAIEVLRTWEEDASESERKDYTLLLTKALVARADVLAAYGNVRMLQRAIDAIESHEPTMTANKTKLARLKTALAKKQGSAGTESRPHVIKLDKPMTGEGVWVDDGQGYTIEGTATLNGKSITVKSGFVLDGGTIDLDEGTMDLQGTSDRPIIFRNVHVVVELGGALKANFAVFEDCTFSKGGGWYSWYSSKWMFTDCLLRRSNFVALTGVDFGVQIKGCAVLECKLPQRPLCGDPPGDAAAAYNDGWNAVEENGFVKCEVAPSFTWMTKRCYFSQCTVKGWDNYNSTTDLQVLMSVPPGSRDFVRSLTTSTDCESKGQIHYVNATPKEAAHKRKMPAWAFVGASE